LIRSFFIVVRRVVFFRPGNSAMPLLPATRQSAFSRTGIHSSPIQSFFDPSPVPFCLVAHPPERVPVPLALRSTGFLHYAEASLSYGLKMKSDQLSFTTLYQVIGKKRSMSLEKIDRPVPQGGRAKRNGWPLCYCLFYTSLRVGYRER
jgi:hypothetical protein